VVTFTYIVRVVNGKREQLMKHLKKKGVDSGIHYIPAHLFTFYKRYRAVLPHTRSLYDQIVTLPLYCDMSDQDVDEVISGIKNFFKKNK